MRSFQGVDLELLEGKHNFTRFYSDFCKLAGSGADTTEIIQKLRKLVKGELLKATQRVEESEALRKIYTECGRHDLAVLMQDRAKAARKLGFQEDDIPAGNTIRFMTSYGRSMRR
ncbi:hypothetical protein B0H12DRAFT_196041 [Mycena haematopus]|nr:hypothetical protein B0H12DRAFT_196041 [Mycena haematopus]